MANKSYAQNNEDILVDNIFEKFQIIPSFLRKYPRDNSIFSNFLRFINKRIK